MDDPVKYIDRRQVAALLGVRLEWLDRNIKRLRRQGFPSPVPNLMSRKQLYDPRAIRAFQDARLAGNRLQSSEQALAEEARQAAGDDAAWGRELARRSKEQAHGGKGQ